MKKWLNNLDVDRVLSLLSGSILGIIYIYITIKYGIHLNIGILIFASIFLFSLFMLIDKKKFLIIPASLLIIYDIYYIYAYISNGYLSYFFKTTRPIIYSADILFFLIILFTTIPKLKSKKNFIKKLWLLPFILWISPFGYYCYLGTNILYYWDSILEYISFLIICFVISKKDSLKIKLNFSKITSKFKDIMIVLIIIFIMVLIAFATNDGNDSVNPYDMAARLERMACREKSDEYFKCKWSLWEQQCTCKLR